MKAKQAIIIAAKQTGIVEVFLPEPSDCQILVATACSVISAGTELAVYTGAHQWLQDPKMVDWKFPFKPGYSAAGTVVKVGSKVHGLQPGDRIAFPGNHASAELLTLGHERCRWWQIPNGLDFATAAWTCVARYGMGAAIRAGVTLGRSAAVMGLGVIGQFSLRCLKSAGAYPVIGIDSVAMRREAALAGGADFVVDPSLDGWREKFQSCLPLGAAEIVADATGVPDALPTAMSLACAAGQVVVVGSPRGRTQQVNFYDDLHRRYLEVTGAHGNMLFEPAHTRIPGDWNIDKASNWLLAAMANGQLNMDGLVSQSIAPENLGEAYEGLLHHKDKFLGVMVNW